MPKRKSHEQYDPMMITRRVSRQINWLIAAQLKASVVLRGESIIKDTNGLDSRDSYCMVYQKVGAHCRLFCL